MGECLSDTLVVKMEVMNMLMIVTMNLNMMKTMMVMVKIIMLIKVQLDKGASCVHL